MTRSDRVRFALLTGILAFALATALGLAFGDGLRQALVTGGGVGFGVAIANWWLYFRVRPD